MFVEARTEVLDGSELWLHPLFTALKASWYPTINKLVGHVGLHTVPGLGHIRDILM